MALGNKKQSVLFATVLLLLLGTLTFQLFLMGNVNATETEEPTITSNKGTSSVTDELEQILNEQHSEKHQFQAEINQLLGMFQMIDS